MTQGDNFRLRCMTSIFLCLMAMYPLLANLSSRTDLLSPPDIIQLAPLFIPYLIVTLACLAILGFSIPKKYDLVVPIAFVLLIYSLFPIVQLPRFFIPATDDFFSRLAIARAVAASGQVPQTSDPYTLFSGFGVLIGSLLLCVGAQSVLAAGVLALCLNALLDIVNVTLMYKSFISVLGRNARVVPILFYSVNTAIYGTIDILGPSKIGFTLLLVTLLLVTKSLRTQSRSAFLAIVLVIAMIAYAHPISLFPVLGMLLLIWGLFRKRVISARPTLVLLLLGVIVIIAFTLLGPGRQIPQLALANILAISRFELHYTYTIPYSSDLLSQVIYWYSRMWYIIVAGLAVACLVRTLRKTTDPARILWAILAGIVLGLSPFMVISRGALSNRLVLLGMIPLSAIAVLEANQRKRLLPMLTLALILTGSFTFVIQHQMTFPYSVHSWDFTALQFVAGHRADADVYSPSIKPPYVLALDYPGRPYSVMLYSAFNFVDIYGGAAQPNYLWFMSWRESAFNAYGAGNPHLFAYEAEQTQNWSQSANVARIYDNSFNTVFSRSGS